jgi:hypothetical protein
VLQATRGAFRFATGRIKALKQKKIAVSTPVADIGVRGTEFWGGALDGRYGVLLLEGEGVVSNQAGSVVLSAQGQGTDVPSPFDPPRPPLERRENRPRRGDHHPALSICAGSRGFSRVPDRSLATE